MKNVNAMPHYFRPQSRVLFTLPLIIIYGTLLINSEALGQKRKVKSTSLTVQITAAQDLLHQQAITNLRAFAKLYGYIRYFHPSDEAARMNWGKFAVYGAQKVKNARTNVELQQSLKELFLPIAPTLQILRTGETPLPPIKPNTLKGLKIVAWQHKGVDVGMYNFGENTPYKSLRLNRDENISQSELRLGFMQVGKERLPTGGLAYTLGKIQEAKLTSGSVQVLWGKELKFSIALRTELEDDNGYAQTFLRIDTTGGQRGFYGNNYNRPITSSSWAEYSVTADVPKSAEGISFGWF